jgi:ATP-dependent Clp protease ATP-binding subunit ClpA
MIRRSLADELLFGRLVSGGKVTVDLDEKNEIKLSFPEGGGTPASTAEIEEIDA